jgi:hypothetical protein
VNYPRSKNFTEIKDDWIQQNGGNRGSHADVGRLAEPAIWLVVAASVRVRHNLQQKEKRNQGQREGGTRGHAASSPGNCRLCCAAC